MITTITLNAAVDKTYQVECMTPGTVMRVRSMTATAGGKGLNVARVASALGEPVCAAGFLGGHAGAYVEELLGQTPIKRQFVRVAGETRACVNVMDAAGGSTEFLEPGCPVTPEDVERFRAAYEALLSRSDVITISGSMPGGCPADLYADLIEMAKRRTVPVLLDTSGENLQRGIAARPTLIKPNRDELMDALGGEAEGRSLYEALAALHQKGLPYVVHSMGAQGAVMACAEGIFRATPPAIEAVNPVGCGDAMVAAFAVGIKRGLTPAALLAFAVEVSAASAIHPSTGGLNHADYEALRGRAAVEKVG